MIRVGAYVDGFNLYYGLRTRYQRKYLWLDVEALAASLLRSDQTLAYVTYFTARVLDDHESQQRQSDYLQALAAHCPMVTTVTGRFQRKRLRCPCCRAHWIGYEEKETDVNIATALVADAMTDRYDTALLISADSDLCPAIVSTKQFQAQKRIVAAFPPNRHSAELKHAADGHLFIGHDKVRRSQLPSPVTIRPGVSIDRPKHWT